MRLSANLTWAWAVAACALLAAAPALAATSMGNGEPTDSGSCCGMGGDRSFGSISRDAPCCGPPSQSSIDRAWGRISDAMGGRNPSSPGPRGSQNGGTATGPGGTRGGGV